MRGALNPNGTPRVCGWRVRRGGPSSGGGYDRLNYTRQEECGHAPADPTALFCARHQGAQEARKAQALARQAEQAKEAARRAAAAQA